MRKENWKLIQAIGRAAKGLKTPVIELEVDSVPLFPETAGDAGPKGFGVRYGVYESPASLEARDSKVQGELAVSSSRLFGLYGEGETNLRNSHSVADQVGVHFHLRGLDVRIKRD